MKVSRFRYGPFQNRAILEVGRFGTWPCWKWGVFNPVWQVIHQVWLFVNEIPIILYLFYHLDKHGKFESSPSGGYNQRQLERGLAISYAGNVFVKLHSYRYSMYEYFFFCVMLFRFYTHVLTLYSIDTHFSTSTNDRFWKHCGKRKNCS